MPISFLIYDFFGLLGNREPWVVLSVTHLEGYGGKYSGAITKPFTKEIREWDCGPVKNVVSLNLYAIALRLALRTHQQSQAKCTNN